MARHSQAPLLGGALKISVWEQERSTRRQPLLLRARFDPLPGDGKICIDLVCSEMVSSLTAQY